jgi:hypothetical protein
VLITLNVKLEAMNEEIKNIIEATSMGKLEKQAVIKSLLDLHNVVGQSEQLVCDNCEKGKPMICNECYEIESNFRESY